MGGMLPNWPASRTSKKGSRWAALIFSRVPRNTLRSAQWCSRIRPFSCKAPRVREREGRAKWKGEGQALSPRFRGGNGSIRLETAPESERPSGVEAIEPGGVGAGDLEAIFGAGVLEIARDNLLRVRPGRGLVRVVGRPHQFVDTYEVAALVADIVVDVGGPHLALEVFARLQLVDKTGGDALALEGAIHALQIVGQPADIVFGGDDLQFREAVEHAREDQDAERLLHLVRQHRRAHVALTPIALALHAPPGDRVQANRHFEFLRRRPKRIIDFRAVRLVLGRRAPDHRPP